MLPYVKQIASANLRYVSGNSNLGLCDNLDAWDGEGGGRGFQEGGAHVYLRLIHVGVWQKSTQYYKAIILQ